ncbi:hypothetical protein AMJ52_08875 [candidate division TA06 bacterium DG_78]|uniref:DUF4386 domain-containing protein n=1 Tax=candidate division TA06 bacterium DG_78 TaxID=1703772 RepID=A0A0S7YAS7_UNCT6|nr:MAG: hypothetical protein AMJ52_08875 [candidate division TA06 bacterium DG_78]
MEHKKIVRLAGYWFAILPPFFIILFELMTMYFEYPTILREPAGKILELYLTKMPTIVVYAYLLLFASFLFVPLSVIAYNLFNTGKKSILLQIGTVIGIIAGSMNALAFFRWVWLVPNLSYIYTDPTVSQATRDAAVVTFESFHIYAGVSIGELFGMNLLGIWGIVIAIMLLRSSLIKQWLAWIGIILAALIVAGAFQVFGIKAAGTIVAISANIWAAWMVVIGITLIVKASKMK